MHKMRKTFGRRTVTRNLVGEATKGHWKGGRGAPGELLGPRSRENEANVKLGRAPSDGESEGRETEHGSRGIYRTAVQKEGLRGRGSKMLAMKERQKIPIPEEMITQLGTRDFSRKPLTMRTCPHGCTFQRTIPALWHQ